MYNHNELVPKAFTKKGLMCIMNKSKSLLTDTIDWCFERGRKLIHVIICDDDRAFLKSLHQLIETSLKQLGVPANIHSYISIEQITKPVLANCDIAFLDIDLNQPQYNGFDIARKLRAVRNDAVIIFVTNYIEYAPEGYEVQAFRYLLKKNYREKIYEYIKEAVSHIENANQTLKIKINGEVIEITLNSILYIESQLRTVIIHVQKDKGKKQYACYAAISDLETQLEPQGFLRIHKSFLVNMHHLKKYQCHEAILNDGTVLRVSARNYAEQKKKYLFWKGC